MHHLFNICTYMVPQFGHALPWEAWVSWSANDENGSQGTRGKRRKAWPIIKAHTITVENPDQSTKRKQKAWESLTNHREAHMVNPTNHHERHIEGLGRG